MSALTVLLALSPIIWLIVALSILKLPAWQATSVAAIGSFIIAITAFQKDPFIMVTGALEGAALAIWPILLVITAAIFVYNLVVHTKAMETIKTMLSSVTSDTRVLALLLAWGFGAFMEGMAGFGTAVAIPAAMMVAVSCGSLSLDKLEAMTCVCSVGLDMIAIPGDTTADTISAIIADESAIGMINNKTTAVRVIPVPGKTVGEVVEFGGLLGYAPIIEVSPYSAAEFIARGGRIPAPIRSLTN